MIYPITGVGKNGAGRQCQSHTDLGGREGVGAPGYGSLTPTYRSLRRQIECSEGRDTMPKKPHGYDACGCIVTFFLDNRSIWLFL